MHEKSPHLDGQYAAFGKIIEGMETVNAIAKTKTDRSDMPKEPQVMKSVTVELFGENYPEPTLLMDFKKIQYQNKRKFFRLF